MLLIEADGKALFAAHGIPVPAGPLVTGPMPALHGPGPWVVKAQVPPAGAARRAGSSAAPPHPKPPPRPAACSAAG